MMKLVIGGAYQGKLNYAQTQYGFTDGWIDGRECTMAEIADCRGIYQFHEYVRRLMENEDSPGKGCPQFGNTDKDLAFIEQYAQEFDSWLTQNNPELVIVSNELGYGIVPMDKKDRMWRELVGRICTGLAAYSDEVVRVVCGIGTRLK